MAVVWSRLALAALVASVAASAGTARAAGEPHTERARLACIACHAAVVPAGADRSDGAVAIAATPPRLEPPPTTAFPTAPPRLEMAAVAADVLPFAPKTSPPTWT
jgi:hypothetical protein